MKLTLIINCENDIFGNDLVKLLKFNHSDSFKMSCKGVFEEEVSPFRKLLERSL
jgi:hypothetical protein